MAQVPRIPTPITEEAIAPLLANGLASRIGRTPIRDLALLLLAQLWLETRRGKPLQWNIGNLSAGGYANGKEVLHSGDFWRPPWFDQGEIDALTDPVKKKERQTQHAQMLAGEIPSAFKAFDSIEEGLAAYLDLLFRPIYEPLLRAAASGDPLAFAQEIKHHYNPDPRYDPVATSRTFASLVQGFSLKGLFDMLPKVEPAEPAPVSPLPSGSVWVLTPSDVVSANPAPRANKLAVLRHGCSGGLVAVWQTLLNVRAAPEPPLEITGEFDKPTETLTKIWQKKNGLVDDGIVGIRSWSVML